MYVVYEIEKIYRDRGIHIPKLEFPFGILYGFSFDCGYDSFIYKAF